MSFSHINEMLYQSNELIRSFFAPYRFVVQSYGLFEKTPLNLLNETMLGGLVAASFELLERFTRNYPKLEYGISDCLIEGQKFEILQQTILPKSFCHLLHFKKIPQISQPKLLIIAPISGHHSTLLRSTIKEALPYFDIYLTDWVNARDVPLSHGNFDLDSYIDYVVDFVNYLGSEVHIFAICQAAVPALAATALAHAHKSQHHVAKSLTMMGGPIDTSKNPTEVNKLALNSRWREIGV